MRRRWRPCSCPRAGGLCPAVSGCVRGGRRGPCQWVSASQDLSLGGLLWMRAVLALCRGCRMFAPPRRANFWMWSVLQRASLTLFVIRRGSVRLVVVRHPALPAFGVTRMSQPLAACLHPCGSVVPFDGLNDCRTGESRVVLGGERPGRGSDERMDRWTRQWISLWITLWITEASGPNRFAAAGHAGTTRSPNLLDPDMRSLAFHVKHFRFQNRDRIHASSAF